MNTVSFLIRIQLITQVASFCLHTDMHCQAMTCCLRASPRHIARRPTTLTLAIIASTGLFCYARS